MDDAALFSRALVSCGVILATLGTIAWAIRHVRGRPLGARVAWPRMVVGPVPRVATPRRLEILERIALAPGAGLVLVRCGERSLLIAHGAPALPTLLASFDDVVRAPPPQEMSGCDLAQVEPPGHAPEGGGSASRNARPAWKTLGRPLRVL